MIEAFVKIVLTQENGETSGEATDRLYDLLFDGLCRNADCNFWIYNVEEID